MAKQKVGVCLSSNIPYILHLIPHQWAASEGKVYYNLKMVTSHRVAQGGGQMIDPGQTKVMHNFDGLHLENNIITP